MEKFKQEFNTIENVGQTEEIEKPPKFTEAEEDFFNQIMNEIDVEFDTALKLEPYKFDIVDIYRSNIKNNVSLDDLKNIAKKRVNKILANINKAN